MNIEDKLSALSAEAKSLPEQMNMERIKHRVKRRKMIHSFGTVGKIAAALFALRLSPSDPHSAPLSSALGPHRLLSVSVTFGTTGVGSCTTCPRTRLG